MNSNGAKPLVFVSHAGVDKKAHIRPIVDFLLREGFEVFVDRPREMGYKSAEIDRRFKFIPPGDDWRESIRNALRECSVVLVCFSKALLEDRAILRREISYAATSGKIVSCTVDDLTRQELQDSENLKQTQSDLFDIANLQAPRMNTTVLRQAFASLSSGAELQENGDEDQARDDLMFIFKRLLEQAESGHSADIDPEDFEPQHDWDRHLAGLDRKNQELDWSRIIGPYQQGAYIFVGPENERLAKYPSDQLTLEGAPDDFPVPMTVEWPGASVQGVQFAKAMQLKLSKALFGQGAGLCSEREIVEFLSDEHRGAGLFLTPLRVKHMSSACLENIASWAEFWKGLAARHANLSLIPVLAVKSPATLPGWQQKTEAWLPEIEQGFLSFGRKQKKSVPVQKVVDRIQNITDSSADFEITVLQRFSPVEAKDFELWKDQIFFADVSRSTNDPILETLNQLFDGDRTLADRLASAIISSTSSYKYGKSSADHLKFARNELRRASELGLSMQILHAIKEAVMKNPELVNSSSRSPA